MRRGQSKKKSSDLSDIAEDANVIEETKNTPKNDDFGSLLTDPSSIETEFEFEKPPTSESIPLNTPLAGETSSEGQTMKQLGFDVSDLGGFEDVRAGGDEPKVSMGGGNNVPPPPPNNNNPSFDSIGGGQNMGGMGFDDGIIDDVPPPNPNQKDLFDEFEEVGGKGGGGAVGNAQLPPDFVAWSAEKQAKWIVSTEKIVAEGFIQNSAKINTLDVRQEALRSNIPSNLTNQVVSQVGVYNTEVENQLTLSREAQRSLEMAWTAVLKQHSNISEKLTPEVALVITHAATFGQLWFQARDFKKHGKGLLMDIKSIFIEHEEATKFKTPPPSPNANTEKK